MKPSSAFVILLLFVMCGCTNRQKPKQTLQEKQKELKVGKLDDKNVYSVMEVGWTAKLPGDWKVLSRRESDNLSAQGKALVEEASRTKIEDSQLVHLVDLRKDNNNLFQSTMEPVDDLVPTDYDNHIMLLRDFIKEVYESRGIPADYAVGAVKIDGLWFNRLEITAYSANKKKVIFEQKLFNALINGYDFGIGISYNNDKDEETLMKVIMGSKFSIKE